MTKQQFNLFIQLALTVYRMASPEDQRTIERLMAEMEAAEQAETERRAG